MILLITGADGQRDVVTGVVNVIGSVRGSRSFINTLTRSRDFGEIELNSVRVEILPDDPDGSVL